MKPEQPDRLARLLIMAVVLSLHAALLAAVWVSPLPAPATGSPPVQVTLIDAPLRPVTPLPAPKPAESRPTLPLPALPVPPPEPLLMAAGTAPSPASTPVADASPEPYVPLSPEEPSQPEPPTPGPVVLDTELALSCPDRTSPEYPSFSRRRGETGLVVLQVRIDRQGRVSGSEVERSSGHERLDSAARAAVSRWRCSPASRNGQPVESLAMQPFNFVLGK